MTATDGNFNSAFEKFFQDGIAIVNPVGLHTFNVRMKDNTGNWGPVFKNSVYIETTLGNAHHELAGMMVYPNPVKDILNISYDKGVTAISVYNLLGQQVITKNPDANEAGIDMSGLASGAYLVSIQSEGKIKTVKIIKE
ncbi:MAG: T9SS type A sorting domain-containing protein [Flavobacterium sp. JAD_PAG50586_2]|nr:MAG: T9SS type A sorting domain-containing protein [Flavobacterium sp. JAD_PAG50586_2]